MLSLQLIPTYSHYIDTVIFILISTFEKVFYLNRPHKNSQEKQNIHLHVETLSWLFPKVIILLKLLNHHFRWTFLRIKIGYWWKVFQVHIKPNNLFRWTVYFCNRFSDKKELIHQQRFFMISSNIQCLPSFWRIKKAIQHFSFRSSCYFCFIHGFRLLSLLHLLPAKNRDK